MWLGLVLILNTDKLFGFVHVCGLEITNRLHSLESNTDWGSVEWNTEDFLPQDKKCL